MTTRKETGYRLAVDIGGTFTDIVLETPDGFESGKVLTTPERPEQGVIDGVKMVLEKANVSATQLDIVIHGTTLATNAIIERRGARTALSAASGWSRLTFKSASSVSRAGWSSSAITTLSRASVTTRTLDTGLQPWVTREIKSTCGPKATPLMPPLKTPLLRPWPGSVPSPDSANCTLRPRLLDSPPNR